MNHKYSSYVLIFLLFLFGIASALAYLDSSDLDDICNVDTSFLYRNSGTWMCANLTDTEVNITVNNITNLYTNWSVHSNYWDNLDDPMDINIIAPSIIASTVDSVNSLTFTKQDNVTDVMSIDTLNGRVGINTEAPSDLFVVNGVARFTNTVKLADGSLASMSLAHRADEKYRYLFSF